MHLLLEAWFGLRPWDDMHDPREYEWLLEPGVSIPPNVIRTRTSAAPPSKPASIDGDVRAEPARVRLTVGFHANPQLAVQLLKGRQRLRVSIDDESLGEVDRDELTPGHFELVITTRDARAVTSQLHLLVRELGLADAATLEVLPRGRTHEDEEAPPPRPSARRRSR